MIQRNPQRDLPKVDESAYIHDTAVIIGKVEIGKNVFIGPGAVIRTDEPNSFIYIGDNTNVQDQAIIHVLGDSSVIIGENTSLAHGSIIHGPSKIGKNCFIGFASVIFRAEIGDNVYIGHKAIVEGVGVLSERVVESGQIVCCEDDVKGLKPLDRKRQDFMERVIRVNLDLVRRYKIE